MKIIFKWWTWRNGQNRREVDIWKTKDGYVSKGDWNELLATMIELEGKKVNVYVDFEV